MVRYAKDHADFAPAISQSAEELVDLVYKPVRTFLDHKDYTTAIDINPNYIKPEGMMYRLMKATHEYGAGTATYYTHVTVAENSLLGDQGLQRSPGGWGRHHCRTELFSRPDPFKTRGRPGGCPAGYGVYTDRRCGRLCR